MRLILLLLACATDPPEPMLLDPAPLPVAEPAAPIPEEPPPAGKIDGEPILPKAIVLGAIGRDEVEEAVTARGEAFTDCWKRHAANDPSLSGKVLVKFTIAADGTVSTATTRSTSLRHEPTERCLNQAMSEIRFPPLKTGRLAIVHYPFAFGSEPAEELTTPR